MSDEINNESMQNGAAPEEASVNTANSNISADGTYSYKPEGEQASTRVSSTYTDPSYSRTSGYSAPNPPQPPVKNKKQKGLGGKIIALALVCAIIGGIIGAGGMYFTFRTFAKTETAQSETKSSTSDNSGESVVYEATRTSNVETQSVETGEEYDASQVYAMNVNSTVGITTSIVTNYWGYQSTSAASGSGFIISADGYILTNYHVIEDSSSITVTDYSGNTYEAAAIGYDESNDIAVLKIDAEGLTPVVLGDSDTLNVGDEVVAIGNPLGELTFSLTKGIVSALNRAVTISTGVTMNLIQTDCAINSGNSGGALFNMYGEVIGITNAKYSSSSSSSTASIDNIGFAIPINTVKDIVTSIIENGYISKPYIGVSVSTVSTEAQSYGTPAGAAIQSVTDGSPAAEAGLQQNDIITAVDGKAVSSSSELVEIISACEPGDVKTLTVYRSGETITLEITIGEQTQSALPETTETTDSSADGQSNDSMNGYDPFSGFGGFGGFGGYGGNSGSSGYGGYGFGGNS